MRITAQQRIRTIVAGLCLLIGPVAQASALTVAVFPLDDLSSAHNSINQAMTETIRREVSGRGVQVVAREQVEDFMSAHRIRRLGVLQGQEIAAARDELHADLVLLGSVCQQNNTARTLGETISLVRTSDGRVIWSSSKGVSLLAEQRLLGIDAPSTMDDLQAILVRDLFVTWPLDLEALAGRRSSQGDGVIGSAGAAIAVDSVLLTPQHVRPGENVTCTIRFTMRHDYGGAKVFVRVGNRIHTARTDDGLYYQVTWVGSDGKGGNPVQVAMANPEPHIINGIWSGERQDARYPVSLILEWPSGRREELYLGAYVVDSAPPEAIIKAAAKSIDGLPAFRKELPISIVFRRNEPIDHWEFAVTSVEGKPLLEEKGVDQPPGEFLWRGQDSKNQRLDPGVYQISLTVWDRAGNMGSASQKVRLLNANPGFNLAVSREQGQIRAILAATDQVAITAWRMELWSADNTMLKVFEGQALPARIDLPDSLGASAGPIGCILQARDALGLKASKKVPNFLAQVTGKDSAAGVKANAGEDDWHADF